MSHSNVAAVRLILLLLLLQLLSREELLQIEARQVRV